MFREDKTEVLVVGAGPVGMLTALLLAESGIEVKIIDQESRSAAHSYACALHPRALKLLDRLGLAAEALKWGRRIETIAFYEGESRRAEMRLSKLPVDFPFVAVLPQSALESLLEKRLDHQDRIMVCWNHRLKDLRSAGDSVVATVDKLSQSAKGYIVPEVDWQIERTLQTRAAFVVGADGHNSHVRQCLDIDYERVAAPEIFAVYEFESDGAFGDEVRIVLDETSTNVLWPLSDRRRRWSFQLVPPDEWAEFPSKDRANVLIVQPAVDVFTRQDVQKFVRVRAPWFAGRVGELEWSTHVRFEHRLAKRFGQGRCWLAGDAAHQTGPVGMQSMNVGLCEAEALASILKRILREKASMNLLAAYDQDSRNEWQRLLGINGSLKPGAQANAWAKERCARILPCIPASGEDLRRLADQVGLDFL